MHHLGSTPELRVRVYHHDRVALERVTAAAARRVSVSVIIIVWGEHRGGQARVVPRDDPDVVHGEPGRMTRPSLPAGHNATFKRVGTYTYGRRMTLREVLSVRSMYAVELPVALKLETWQGFEKLSFLCVFCHFHYISL